MGEERGKVEKMSVDYGLGEPVRNGQGNEVRFPYAPEDGERTEFVVDLDDDGLVYEVTDTDREPVADSHDIPDVLRHEVSESYGVAPRAADLDH